jgi:hypothetical protein
MTTALRCAIESERPEGRSCPSDCTFTPFGVHTHHFVGIIPELVSREFYNSRRLWRPWDSQAEGSTSAAAPHIAGDGTSLAITSLARSPSLHVDILLVADQD